MRLRKHVTLGCHQSLKSFSRREGGWIKLTSCEMPSSSPAATSHVRVAVVAVLAPAEIAVGAARGVEALAVSADAAKAGHLRRRRA